MSKKRMIIFTSVILSVVIISLGIVKLYQTYAIGNYIDTASSATFDVNITRDTSVRIPANGYSNVFYMVTNTSPGTVRYGVAYTTDSAVTVKTFSTSKDSASGMIEENEKKYVKLRLENTSSTVKNIKISTVLGYSEGGDLIPPSGVTLVKDIYTPIPLAQYITGLYNSSTKVTATNNSITYNLAPSQNLMNDRLGNSSTGINNGNVRYYGASPKNYIYFNCEKYPSTNCQLWRIIGVFNGKTKIIYEGSIGNLSWDNKDTTTGAENNSGVNNWTTARLMKLLNPSDYYSTDSNDNGNGLSLYYNSKSGTCFAGINNATTSCNFTSTGIKNDATRNMISSNTWYLGGWNTNAVYPNQIYTYERAKNVYSGRPTTWTGKIALPYPSDYGYAASFGNGTSTLCNTQLGNYGTTTACSNNNWLKTLIENADKGWLLTPSQEMPHHAWRVYTGGLGHDLSCYYATGVSPTLYLDSGVLLEMGTGTSSDPYKISGGSSANLEEPISTYTITYNANNGSGAPSSQTKVQNVDLTLSTTVPTRSGYYFAGWNTSANGSGTTYAAGATYSADSSITLYAQWKPNVVTIKFNINGGTLKSSSPYAVDSNGNVTRDGKPLHTMNYNDTIISTGLPNYNNSSWLNIAKTGYTAVSNAEWKCLSGNCIKSTYGQDNATYKASDFCNLNSGDCTITLGVNWTPAKIKITLNANGGTAGTSAIWYYYGINTFYSNEACTTKITSITVPTRYGYTFNHYYGDGSSGGNNGERYIYSGGTFADDLVTDIYQSTTFYANWSESLIYRYVKPLIGLNCRSGAGSSYSIVTAFSCGTRLALDPNPTNGWYYSAANGCWLSGDYLVTSTPNCSGSSGGTSSGGALYGTCSCSSNSDCGYSGTNYPAVWCSSGKCYWKKAGNNDTFSCY